MGDMPILIGGAGERKTLRMVAEHADIWHSFVGPDDLPRKLEILQGHCEAVGRSMGEIEIANGASVRDGVGGTGFDRLDRFHELGTTLFTIPLSGDDAPEGHALDRLADFLAWRDAQNPYPPPRPRLPSSGGFVR